MSYFEQMEEVLSKIKKAHSLEMEAMQRFYRIKIAEMLENKEKEMNFKNKELQKELPKEATNTRVKEIKEFPPKVDNFVFPTGIYPQAILKPVKKPVICRDCHKQIKGTVHDVGDGFNVCDECFAKRNKEGGMVK